MKRFSDNPLKKQKEQRTVALK
ncbi:hypothetical protein AGR7C_Cc250003 [Agrobacterium deltaense Zutra 3/1]|uniref:Uncharacterized protein n=1 Tax=Agrobacterium deltaense Zutra 3/1 TaxID=1183427 RepID=A0A1S7Q2M3_9HYPH|nr:hypothetical protein AGR6A_Cc140004 [Agrobacterium sp. NCPPB 925]CUX30430.1 hypothetical protein AGR7C_Cc250003 [Agrobacterium deltaense Zutra 3/1]